MDEPGQLIIPHGPEKPTDSGGAPKPEQPIPVIPQPQSEVTAVQPIEQPAVPVTAPVQSPAAALPAEPAAEAGWFHQETTGSAASEPQLPPEGLQWTASEFIAHEKGAEWYAMLAGGGIVLAAVVYVLTRDKISTCVVVFAAITFGVFAGRKPQTQRYAINGRGLQIGQKFYDLQDFKTFSVSMDGAIASIVLSPLKRFMPPLTVYVAPDLEEKVVDFLSAYLPFEQHKADAVDSLLKRIRF